MNDPTRICKPECACVHVCTRVRTHAVFLMVRLQISSEQADLSRAGAFVEKGKKSFVGVEREHMHILSRVRTHMHPFDFPSCSKGRICAAAPPKVARRRWMGRRRGREQQRHRVASLLPSLRLT